LTSDHFFVRKKAVAGGAAVIDGAEHRHLGLVLRVRPGDDVFLFDEEGTRYRGRVASVAKERTVLDGVEILPAPAAPRVRIALGQALLKHRTMDFVIQKATELGAAEIVPVAADRSLTRVDAGWERKAERWARIAREAAKQSRRAAIPAIGPPLSIDALAARPEPEGGRFVLTEKGGPPLKALLLPLRGGAPPDAALVAVGPEGGWTAAEEAALESRGFRSASLGAGVLRAETAALLAVALIDHLWNL
jgi:16S rRNA (uracil1498-N3)-methyltransferase